MNQVNQRPEDVSCEGNSLMFALRNFLGKNCFITLAKIIAVDSETLTAKELVLGQTVSGEKIDNENIYGIPWHRLQSGNSAIIMDPVVGDVGVLLVCDKDISNVKAENSYSLPASKRRHTCSDAIYLGGVGLLNVTPTQSIKFSSSGIDVAAPNGLNITGNVTINGTLVTSNTITATGGITGGGISLDTHVHGGVESGGDTTSGPE